MHEEEQKLDRMESQKHQLRQQIVKLESEMRERDMQPNVGPPRSAIVAPRLSSRRALV